MSFAWFPLRFFRPLFTRIVIALLAVVFLKGSYEVFLRLFYEMQGPYTGDSTIYWAVGRGILNGRIPYVDLFETKPPGIFLLSAVSIALTGGPMLGHFLQTFIIGAVPVLLGIFVWFDTRGKKVEARAFLTTLAVLFGMLLTLFLAERSGEFQVESFGAFFGILYVLTVAWRRERWGWDDAWLPAGCLLFAIGLKEPFLLSLLGTALILVDKKRPFIRIFVLPFAIAALVGIYLLLVLGFWSAYIDTYLPLMLGGHIQNYGSWWERGLSFRRVFDDLNEFAQPLGYIVILLLAVPALTAHSWRKKYVQAGLTACRIALGVYLLVIGVGLGGEFWNHHFAIAIPGYVALFVLTMRAMERWNIPARLLYVTTATLIGIAIFFVPRHYQDRLGFLLPDARAAKTEAAMIDAIMDKCGIERYLFFGSNGTQAYGYTKHSPEGPFFVTFGPPLDYIFSAAEPELRLSFLRSLSSAKLAVVDEYLLGDLTDYTKNYMDEYFTETPWSCAAPVAGASRYRILYRKGL